MSGIVTRIQQINTSRINPPNTWAILFFIFFTGKWIWNTDDTSLLLGLDLLDLSGKFFLFPRGAPRSESFSLFHDEYQR